MRARATSSKRINTEWIIVFPKPPIRMPERNRHLLRSDRIRRTPFATPVARICQRPRPNPRPPVILQKILLREEMDVSDLGALLGGHFLEIAQRG